MSTQLEPKNVVGRDELIAHIWKVLEKNSVVFTAERRIGKTTVMNKMRAEPKKSVIVTYIDLEKVETPQRFVEVLLSEIKELLPTTEQAKTGFVELLKKFSGTEIGGIIKLPEMNKEQWIPALEKTLACICEHHRDAMVLFLFDELPYMLQKIAIREKKAGGNTNHALAILDSLRAIRNEQHNLRMIYSGSIGLHHVVHALRGDHYASQPTNDMTVIPIGPIAEADAKTLAQNLFTADNVTCNALDDVLNEIVSQTDCVPFYIERVIQKLALSPKKLTPKLVCEVIQQCLSDDLNHWEMEHFRTRIPIYYPDSLDCGDRTPISHASIASTILDILATTDKPLSIEAINAAVKARLPIEKRELIVTLLKNLSQDHYLTCDHSKHYSFRFPLIKRWWKLNQGL